MIEKELVELYKKTKKQLANLLEDLTFANFYRALQSGKRTYTLKNTQVTRTIDEDWVNAIKNAVPHIDSIINNPRKYMKRETEVVPVEKARIVDSESVKHLAAHTNFINKVDEKGFVQPNKILTAYNEESYALYENRFVMTLIYRVCQFIDRRYFLLGTGGNEFATSMSVDGTFEQAGEETEYQIKMNVHQNAEYFEGGISNKVYEDLFTIRKYMNSFKYSPFVKLVSANGQVRPPIVNTNLLSKDPHYKACVELWDFIENYNKVGYKIEIQDSAPLMARELIDDLDSVNILQYVALKIKMGEFDPRRRAMQKSDKKVIKPELLDYEPTKTERYELGGTQNLKNYLHNKNNADNEQAIKEVMIRALRNEALKRELEDRERRERDQKIGEILKNAIENDKRRTKEKEDYKRDIMLSSIREALKLESEKAKERAHEELAKSRPAIDILKKQLRAFEENEQFKLEQRKLEEKQTGELMNAILSDLIRIEKERDYIRTNPAAQPGGENLPVPLPEESLLPVAAQEIEPFKKMFAPPLRVTVDDWKELKKYKLPRRRKFSEDALTEAIMRAIKVENARSKRLKREQERADAEAAKNAENAANGADMDSDLHADGVSYPAGIQQERESIKNETSTEAQVGQSDASDSALDEVASHTDSGDEDMQLTLWQRFLRWLLFWKKW